MWFIYISLCMGFLIGAINILPKKIKKHNDLFTLIGISSLLFVMGISIGINKDIINNIGTFGLIGFIYSFFSVLGSVIIVYVFTSLILRRKSK